MTESASGANARGYEDLEVFRRAIALVKPLHDLVVCLSFDSALERVVILSEAKDLDRPRCFAALSMTGFRHGLGHPASRQDDRPHLRDTTLVARFPDYEKFELASQMRRACKSVPTNIAEGYAKRRSPKDFCNFLTIALGSANEMEVHFRIALELGYVSEGEAARFCDEYEIVGKQLTNLIKYWRSNVRPATTN